MAREKLWDRELTSTEQADMDKVKELMAIVNQDPPFTEEAKETFRQAVINCGAAIAMMNKFILTTTERKGLLDALFNLVGSLKVN